MPKILKPYTGTGDAGQTSVGRGRRASKTCLQVSALGSLDELNSMLGVARSHHLGKSLDAAVKDIQNDLFHLGSMIYFIADNQQGGPNIGHEQVDSLVNLIDRFYSGMKPLPNFVLPGGTPTASYLQLARAVCRRAEREVIALYQKKKLLISDTNKRAASVPAIAYLNRLSSFLYVAARYENMRQGKKEIYWNSRT